MRVCVPLVGNAFPVMSHFQVLKLIRSLIGGQYCNSSKSITRPHSLVNIGIVGRRKSGNNQLDSINGKNCQ